MGLIKKIYESDGSKILVLPKLWVKWVEKRTGKPLKLVELDVATDEIRIKPFLEE
jgi:hypothetical protein